MTELLSRFDAALGDVFNQPVVQLGLRAIGLYLVVLWLASAVWAYRDMRHRAESEVASYLAAGLIVAATPVFFPLAIVVYRIVRPPETLTEAWDRRLDASALEAEADALQGCYSCGRRTDREWLVCPTCGAKLHRVCADCGQLIDLDWIVCAWCGHEIERPGGLPLEAPIPETLSAGRPLAPVPMGAGTLATAASLGATAAVPGEASPRPSSGRSPSTSGVGAR
jgi:RNA polymerase subunit RPABC4/transcription elongation factor Spt4